MIDKAKLQKRRRQLDSQQKRCRVPTCCWCGSASIYAYVDAYCDHDTKLERHSTCFQCLSQIAHDLENRLWNTPCCNVTSEHRCRVTHASVYILESPASSSSDSQPGPVDRRAQNQATSGLPQADPPAAGTDRHDTLCPIPDHANGVSSRGLPDHALAPDVQAGQPHANGPDSTRTERAARCDQSVSGTDRDEDTRDRSGASSLADSAG